MELLIYGHDHFELMWNLPKVINPEDFLSGATSYFTFQLLQHGQYQIQIAENSYMDDMLFMKEVSSKIAGRQIYGFISYSNNELTLGFRGLHFIAEFERQDNKWVLRWFEDFNIRERSKAEERFEIMSDYIKMKKMIS